MRNKKRAASTITPDTLNGHFINRTYSISDAVGYTRTYSYDNLDRVTLVTYPDGTTESSSYLNPATGNVDLDIHSSTDRLNRTTTREYDAIRRLTKLTDPDGKSTLYNWCLCGALNSFTDPKGQTTSFIRDLRSRVLYKKYPDNSQIGYTYDEIGRLKTTTDVRLDVATTTYNLDNTVQGVAYTLGSGSTAAATPSLSYIYDPKYPRLTSAGTSGTLGYVAYAYKANSVGTLGAGKVDNVISTFTGGTGTVTYTYDEWGRKKSTNTGSNNQTVTYDSLGQVTNVTNLLGSFAYSYFDPTHPTGRVASISMGASLPYVQYDYYGTYGSVSATGDENLKQIKYTTTPTSTVVISQQDYTYDAAGRIATWKQQTDNNTSLLWTEGYDGSDQLTSAVQTYGATTTVMQSNAYEYDAAGNRTKETLPGKLNFGTFNALNQLTAASTTSTLSTSFAGAVNKPGTLTINGANASLTSTNTFNVPLPLPAGTNTVTFVAQDTDGNTRTNKYQVVVAGTNSAPTYDADGNETANGLGQTYTWNARNELITIGYPGGATTTFNYDAMGRRIGIVESTGSTKQFQWDGDAIVDERNSSNTVGKRFYTQGERIGSTLYYYTKDHLGSVREMINLGTGAIAARYDYDPYGRPIPGQSTNLISGSNLANFQYAGYYEHLPSGFNLTKYRAYESNAGRWLSRDPIGENGGINIFGYVRNNPVNSIDYLGLEGLWVFVIFNSPGGGRQSVDVSYEMSGAEKKCCGSVEIKRYLKGNLWGWNSDDTVGGTTGNGFSPAHAEGDSPGGMKLLDWDGYSTPSLVDHTYVFRWDALCTSGKAKGKVLSSRQRTYVSHGNKGSWDSKGGDTSISD